MISDEPIDTTTMPENGCDCCYISLSVLVEQPRDRTGQKFQAYIADNNTPGISGDNLRLMGFGSSVVAAILKLVVQIAAVLDRK